MVVDLTNEKKKEEEEPSEDTDSKGDTDKGVQPETVSELDRADSIAERQKRENDRREAILDREESLAARQAVGGKSEAGQPEVKEKEETPKEYKDRVMSGEI